MTPASKVLFPLDFEALLLFLQRFSDFWRLHQLWNKNKKSKILHPEKEYFFLVFPNLVIVSERMITLLAF